MHLPSSSRLRVRIESATLLTAGDFVYAPRRSSHAPATLSGCRRSRYRERPHPSMAAIWAAAAHPAYDGNTACGCQFVSPVQCFMSAAFSCPSNPAPHACKDSNLSQNP